MIIRPSNVRLKNGQTVVARSPRLSEAEAFGAFFRAAYALWSPHESTAIFLKKYRSSKTNFIVGLYLGKTLVATISCFGNKNEIYKHTARWALYAHPNMRGAGLGTALFQIGLRQSKAAKYKRVELTILKQNKPMHALCKNFKFKQAGHLRKNVFITGHFYDELIFERSL